MQFDRLKRREVITLFRRRCSVTACGAALVQVLKQAGSDLSRENIMRQATNLRDLELPMLFPGIKVNTSPTDYYAVQQLQLVRFDGKRWVRFGDLVYFQ